MTTQSPDERKRDELDREVFNAFQKHQFGQFDEAFSVYSDVLRVMPEHEDALHYMGLLAQQSGKSEDAVKLIQRSLEIRRENPDALNHLGQVYIALSDYVTAEQCFRQALVYDKNHFHAINNLANCFKNAGNLETALIHYERAVTIEPRNPICVFNLGSTLNALGRHWDAVEWLTKATQYEHGNYMAHHKLGISFEQLGKFDEANANFLTALRYRPTYYESLAALLNSSAYESSEAQAETAQNALDDGGLTDEARVRLEHALGKYFDKAGNYRKAFKHFRNSNEIQKTSAKPFDIEFIVNEFDKYIEFYSAENIERLSRFGSKDERPIFVVGMPRTGTSLTEQILSSHSEVHGAGELKLMQQTETRLELPLDQGGLGGLSSQPPPLTQESIEYLCRFYLDGLNDKSPDSAVRVVDKFPMNCVHLGLISILFPRARIIHCQRNPLDVALSCYTVLFKMGNDFTNDLLHFGQYYKEYKRLMAHWTAVLTIPIFDLQYEDLVRESEEMIKKLVVFCDLPWEDECLSFAANERAVRTPSNWQVRQELYDSSINRWANYEEYLLKLKELLES
jgi:tetratricopeptide (TPR) repeat protein